MVRAMGAGNGREVRTAMVPGGWPGRGGARQGEVWCLFGWDDVSDVAVVYGRVGKLPAVSRGRT